MACKEYFSRQFEFNFIEFSDFLSLLQFIIEYKIMKMARSMKLFAIMLISYFACTYISWMLDIIAYRNAITSPASSSLIDSVNLKADSSEVINDLESIYNPVLLHPDRPRFLFQPVDSSHNLSKPPRYTSDFDSNIHLKASVGSSSDTFVRITNNYEYYIVVKAFLIEGEVQTEKNISGKKNLNQGDDRLGGFFLEKCVDKNSKDNPCTGSFFIDNDFTVIMPGEDAVIGRLVFAPTSFGIFHAKLYIKTINKLISRIDISGVASEGTFELFHDSLLNPEKNSIKIASGFNTNLISLHLKNSGSREEHIKGIYFPGFMCSHKSLTIKNCATPLLIKSTEDALLIIEEKFDYIQYAYATELWLHSESRIYAYNLNLEIFHDVPAETSGSYLMFYAMSLLFFMNSINNIDSVRVTRVVSTKSSEICEVEWIKRAYKRPIYKTNEIKQEKIQEKCEESIKNIRERIRSQLSFSPQLVINISKLRNSDEFTLASLNTDTRINSPANSHTEEESEEEFYLDMYKVNGIFSLPQGHCDSAESFNSW